MQHPAGRIMILAPHTAKVIGYDGESTLTLFDLRFERATAIGQHRAQHPIALVAANAHAIAIAGSEEPWSFSARCSIQILGWNLAVQKEIAIQAQQPIWPQSLALSPDNRMIALASFNEQLALLDSTGATLATAAGGEYISGCTFDAQSQMLAAAHTGQGGGWLSIYDVRDGPLRPRQTLLAQPESDSPCAELADTYAAMRFSPDSARLAVYRTLIGGGAAGTLGWQGDLLMYDVATGRLLWAKKLTFGPHTTLEWSESGQDYNTYTNIAFSRSGRTIWCGLANGAIQGYHAEGGSPSALLSSGSNTIPSFDIDYQHNLWVEVDRQLSMVGSVADDA